jgi:hypothetical protein
MTPLLFIPPYAVNYPYHITEHYLPLAQGLRSVRKINQINTKMKLISLGNILSTNLWVSIRRICVGTWNVGGLCPPKDLDIQEWLDMEEQADIYVLG